MRGGMTETSVLESELKGFQQLVEDMQKQRQDLSVAVRQLTESSNSLYEQINKSATTVPSWIETSIDKNLLTDDVYTQNLSNSDFLKNLYEKQEIKTVRVVKRESEKRQKDKERTSERLGLALTYENENALEKLSLHEHYPVSFGEVPKSLFQNDKPNEEQKDYVNDSSYQSYAAKEIITEMVNQGSKAQKRLVPKQKRRHNTEPNSTIVSLPQRNEV